MERRRNRPEKYNRETVAKTVDAMKKIDAIRTRRQERYWEARMAAAKSQKQAADRKELEQQIHLVKAPLAQKQEAEKLRAAVEETQTEGMQE